MFKVCSKWLLIIIIIINITLLNNVVCIKYNYIWFIKKCYNFFFHEYSFQLFFVVQIKIIQWTKPYMQEYKYSQNDHGFVTINCYGITYNFEELGSYVME